MNILLLSNSAPNYFHFFNALAQCFRKDGSQIFVAVDSVFSREQNQLDALGFPIHEFSEFFQNHQVDPDLLDQYAHYNLNSALLSDFERAQTYGLWGDIVGVDYLEKLKSALLAFFHDLFERYSIDLVIYEQVSNAFAHFAFFVAQEKGARYCGVGPSRLPGRFVLSENPLKDDATEKAFNDIQSGHLSVDPTVRQWAADYVAQIETLVPDYMKIYRSDQVSLVQRYFKRQYFNKVVRLLRYLRASRQGSFQIANPPLTHARLFWRNAKRRVHTISLKKAYQSPQPDEAFLLYPLHFHPESSTSVAAGTYLDEYEVIRNIAFNLPQGIKLYVKDHMSAWGYPSRAFYKKVRQLPNVRLLGPNEPTKQLIKQAQAVVTLTSTVGYEALLMQTPVFVFGHVFYGFHKGAIQIENPAALFQTFRTVLSDPPSWDAKYTEDFVCAYHTASFAGVLNLLQTGDAARETAEQFYVEIKPFLAQG